MPRRRFDSEKSANSFAKKVKGRVNDLREIKGAKSNFTVTYERSQKTKSHGESKYDINNLDNFCPEEDRDFGFPNWFWK